jgi:hypothetical protein
MRTFITYMRSSKSYYGDEIKEYEMGRVLARMGEIKNTYKILVGKPEAKRPLGRLWRRWQNNIKMDLREKGWEGVDWIYLAQDRDQWLVLVNTIMNLRVPKRPHDLETT